jgi:hypothetical protein
MTACKEATYAYPERVEANPEEMKSITEHQEVPKEHAGVKSGKALNKRHDGQHLATQRH